MATITLGGEAPNEAFIRQTAPQNAEVAPLEEDLACHGVSSAELANAPNAGFRHADAWNRGTPPRHTKMFETAVGHETTTPGGTASIKLVDGSVTEAFVVTPAPQNVPGIPDLEMLTERVAPGGSTKSTIVLGEDASQEAFVRHMAPQNMQMPEQEVVRATGGKSTIVLGEYVPMEASQVVKHNTRRMPTKENAEDENKVDNQDSENDPNAMNRCVKSELEIQKAPRTVLGNSRAPPGGSSVVILG